MAKTIAQAVENLRAVAPLIGPRYTQGIQNADWQGPASSPEAEASWGAGVQAAMASGARREGIMRVSNADWQRLAITKGAAVIGQRITDSLEKYQRNFAPILSAMNDQAARLPARTASATQNVANRLIPIIHSAQRAAGKAET